MTQDHTTHLLTALKDLLRVAESKLDVSATHEGLDNCTTLAYCRWAVENAERDGHKANPVNVRGKEHVSELLK